MRHGEAEHNVAFRQNDITAFTNEKYTDAPLTEKGVLQSEETGKKLASLKIIDIWSSPLTRCIETVEEVFEWIKVENLYLHDNLLERQGGGYVCNTRKPKGELKNKYPHFDMKSIPDLPSMWLHRESEYILYRRLFMFIKLLEDIYIDADKDSHVLIVGHGDAFHSLLGEYLSTAEFVIMSLEEILQDK